MEPKASLLCLQQPAASPYPEPDQSNVYHPTLLPLNLFQYYPPVCVGFPRVSSLQAFQPEL
jgi:hypothetical protein